MTTVIELLKEYSDIEKEALGNREMDAHALAVRVLHSARRKLQLDGITGAPWWTLKQHPDVCRLRLCESLELQVSADGSAIKVFGRNIGGAQDVMQAKRKAIIFAFGELTRAIHALDSVAVTTPSKKPARRDRARPIEAAR